MPPGHRCDPIPHGRDSFAIHGDAIRVERLDHAERSTPGHHDRDGRRGAEGDVRVHVHVRRGLVAPHNGGQGAQRLPSLGHEVGLGVLVIDARRNFPHRELDIELPERESSLAEAKVSRAVSRESRRRDDAAPVMTAPRKPSALPGREAAEYLLNQLRRDSGETIW